MARPAGGAEDSRPKSAPCVSALLRGRGEAGRGRTGEIGKSHWRSAGFTRLQLRTGATAEEEEEGEGGEPLRCAVFEAGSSSVCAMLHHGASARGQLLAHAWWPM